MAAVVSTRILRLQAVSPRVARSPVIAPQAVAPVAGAGFQGGQTDYHTGVGFFLGYSAGNYKLSIGDPAGNYLTWDGVSLTVVGGTTPTAIGGFAIGTDYVRDAANSMGLASTVTGGDDVRFWAGDTFANRSTAPFYVTESGVVRATNLVLPPQVAPSSPSTGRLYMNSDGSLQYWTGVGWATFITSISCLPPTLSADTLIPGISVATSAPGVVGPYTATPPTLSIDTLIPSISVSAHSP